MAVDRQQHVLAMHAKIESGHRAKAEAVAAHIWEHEQPLAVMLVGSVATGHANPDSDIDLVVLRPGQSRMRLRTYTDEGFRVSIEEYSSSRFTWFDPVPLLDLADLREAGRLTQGRLLHSRWPDLDRARAGWQRAALRPREATKLLLTASATRSTASRPAPSLSERVWWLQGCFSALAMLSLSLSPARFQKPKWVARDLRDHDEELFELLLSLYRLRRHHHIGSTVAWLRDHFDHACAVLDLPDSHTVTFATDEENWQLAYTYRTYLDAMSLERAVDVPGTAYTAFSSLRLMESVLAAGAAPRNAQNQQGIVRWRREALDVMVTNEPGDLDQIGQRLDAHRDRLFRRYTDLYRRAEQLQSGVTGDLCSRRPPEEQR